MSKKITTYEDLLEEELRLENLAHAQRTLVHENFESVKESMRPFGRTISSTYSLISSIAPRHRSTSRLLNMGLDFGVEVLLKRILLANSGWVTRLVLPFLIRNYSSQIAHFFAQDHHKNTWWRRVKKVFSKD